MSKFRFISSMCVCAYSLCISAMLGAELIEKDWKLTNDGLITFDTNTGLEWLDLDAAEYRSYDDISSELGPGGEFEGFTYASEGEVRALFTNTGIPNLSGEWDADNYQPTLYLQALIGITRSSFGESFGVTYETGTSANSVVGIGLQAQNNPISEVYEQARVLVNTSIETDRTAFIAHWLRRTVYPSTSFLGNVVRWENTFNGVISDWDITTVIDPGVEFTIDAGSGQADVTIDLTADSITWNFNLSLTIPGPVNVDVISDENGTIPWIIDVRVDPSTNIAEVYESSRLSYTGNSISLDLANVPVTSSSLVKLKVRFGSEPESEEFPWEIFMPAIMKGAQQK